MNTNSKAGKLKAAHDQHASAQAALEKIQAAVSGKSVPNQDSSAVDSARLELEDCLARRALDEANAAEEALSRTALQNAEQAFDAHKKIHTSENLELIGLNRRLLSAQEAEETTKQALSEAENNWLLEELRIADEAYTKQAEEIDRNYARVEMCAEALKRRRVKIPTHFSSSADMLIPTIGPVSCAAVLGKMNDRDRMNGVSGAGKLLVSASRRDMYKIKNDDIERDLLAVTANNGGTTMGRISKIVTGLVRQSEK